MTGEAKPAGPAFDVPDSPSPWGRWVAGPAASLRSKVRLAGLYGSKLFHEVVNGKELGLAGKSHLLEDRSDSAAKALEGLFGLPDIDYAPPAISRTSDVGKNPVGRPGFQGIESPTVGESSADFLVLLARAAGTLVDHQHGQSPTSLDRPPLLADSNEVPTKADTA